MILTRSTQKKKKIFLKGSWKCLKILFSIKEIQFLCIIKENFGVAGIQMDLKKTFLSWFTLLLNGQSTSLRLSKALSYGFPLKRFTCFFFDKLKTVCAYSWSHNCAQVGKSLRKYFFSENFHSDNFLSIVAS